MPEMYHGSQLRSLAQLLWRRARRAIKRAYNAARYSREIPARVLYFMDETERLAGQQDWDAARSCARQAADIVEAGQSERARRVVGGKLIRLGDCGRGLRLLVETLGSSPAHEWKGEPLSGRRIFIRQLHTSNMGAPLRMARFAAPLVGSAERAVIGVEHRLVPIFQRTFPKAEVRASGRAMADATADDCVTSFEGATGLSVTDWASIRDFPFLPLQADKGLTAELRQSYLKLYSGPLVGLSWGSKNTNKETPPLDLWAAMIDGFPATFVSLQYGSIERALAKLRSGRNVRLIDDRSVDQLVDMDRFAAQVAAMDAVITIDNTCAHLVGAMGVPSVLIVDDEFRRAFPVVGTSSEWFPHTVMTRKKWRSWDAATKDAAVLLRRLL